MTATTQALQIKSDTIFLYRNLIPEKLWNRLVNRIMKDHSEIQKEMAEMIMDSALGFLSLCAKFPEERFSPSSLVDIGWHTFILYTREYADFCNLIAGYFIHHCPTDNGEVNTSGTTTICGTVEFMRKNDFQFNGEMWGLTGDGNCTVDCTDECNSCSDNSCTS